MTQEFDLGFLDCSCERCGASAHDGPLFPGRIAGQWFCEECVDDGEDRISRLMKAEGIGFVEAVGRIARRRAGIG